MLASPFLGEWGLFSDKSDFSESPEFAGTITTLRAFSRGGSRDVDRAANAGRSASMTKAVVATFVTAEGRIDE